MERRYNQEELESFVKGIKKAADIIHMKKPDFIFAPVIGAVPFVDALSIVDRHFPSQSVESPPNSSRFSNRTELLGKWYANFLNANYAGDAIKIICLDEVLSGSSASVGYSQFRKAAEDFVLKKVQDAGGTPELLDKYRKEVAKNIDYSILGIAEDRPRNHSFSRLVNQGKAHVINVKSILTLDDVLLNPLRLKVAADLNPQGRQTYLPEIERFDATPEYLTLLQDIASYVGVNPSSANPSNFGRIQQSLSKYLGN